MSYFIIIPAHNEEAYLNSTLESLLIQTSQPKRVIIVNDNSNDNTESIIDGFVKKSDLFIKLNAHSSNEHMPGSKVINAFNKGIEPINSDYDFIVKLDADLIVPANYFETIETTFRDNHKIGIAGGFIYEQDSTGEWQLNHPMNKNHVRGAFKAYSKDCFKAIGGLRPAMGWDTLDELLAQFYGYEVITLDNLKVKHLRPTGKAYNAKAKLLQGKAMYRMGYGLALSIIASTKMALKQKSAKALFDNLKGFIKAKKEGLPLLVTKEQAKFIKTLRWKGITEKLRGEK